MTKITAEGELRAEEIPVKVPEQKVWPYPGTKERPSALKLGHFSL